MPAEPSVKRTVAFFDGQNLFYGAKHAFGYRWPNYDPLLLADAICQSRQWHLAQVRFYTGLPSVQDEPFWNHFWTTKLAVLGTRGVFTYSRSLRYRNQTVPLPGRRHDRPGWARERNRHPHRIGRGAIGPRQPV